MRNYSPKNRSVHIRDVGEHHLAFDEKGHSAQQLLARACKLMSEALLLLDEASAWQSAALLDHAIAVLPVCDLRAEAKAETTRIESWPTKAVLSGHWSRPAERPNR